MDAALIVYDTEYPYKTNFSSDVEKFQREIYLRSRWMI